MTLFQPSLGLPNVAISNPKLHTDTTLTKELRLFPYYAGYSTVFAKQLLLTLPLKKNAVVFDPWNGSGTTTRIAYDLGYNAFGIDLNPATVVVAKAAMLSQLEAPGLESIAKSIAEQSRKSGRLQCPDDPLLTWLFPKAATIVRALENEINNTLISHDVYAKINSNEVLENVSPLASFFYVALFRTVRRILSDFIPTNPTWVKKPKNQQKRKRPTEATILSSFVNEVCDLRRKTIFSKSQIVDGANSVTLRLGNAEKISLQNQAVDAIVSSPPYCTRIDYAIATAIELAVMRLGGEEFDVLRRSLTGTATVERKLEDVDNRWGGTCIRFLEEVYMHSSKASKTYYYKNHLQYFRSLFQSIREISRVLKPNGYCILVAQNSYYKQIHNDIPAMIAEMGNEVGLHLCRREDFSSARSMAGINGRSRKYIANRNTVESVLCFQAP